MDNMEANIMEKSMRSVFVGNIPYDITEEHLKNIFSEVGHVVSFKLVYDRDDGKPKGYGFCEYGDQETALSAIRNLNNYEVGGRSLRVDNACTEKSRMEILNLLNQPTNKSPYGEAVAADRAPEAVAKTVSCLPPEQMIELMSQMKLTIEHNPTEAKKMLTQNPQLAYALLQTQVMMNVIDETSACRMLHPSNKALASLMPVDKPLIMPIKSAFTKPKNIVSNPVRSEPNPVVVPIHNTTNEPVFTNQDIDMRSAAPPPAIQPKKHVRPPPPRPEVGESSRSGADPRMQKRSDPRQKPSSYSTASQIPPPQPNFNIMNSINPATEQEKAALIMQVLQLTDEQIAMLPPEQRQSILLLKSQIAVAKQ